jgi:prepilin-type N-terminal cleavage/methylation domain-containing protein
MTRRGYTFIELLVVIVVLGILASMGYLRLQASKDKAAVAAMTSDLRAIAEEQEAFYFQNRFYSATLDSLNPRPSPGDSLVIHEATPSGWSGSVSNSRTPKKCYIVVGDAAPVGSASTDGVINCS